MLGANRPTATTQEPDGWRIAEHAGRTPPWSVWRDRHVYYFSDSLFDARRFIQMQPKVIRARSTEQI